MNTRHIAAVTVLLTAAVVPVTNADILNVPDAQPTISKVGTILHVDDDAPLVGNGLSWDTAYRFLQDALANAVAGDEIRVAQGTYTPDQDEGGIVTPGDREATFQLINGVALMGGYAGIGAKDPDERNIELFETIFSGDLLGNDLPGFVNNDENSYNVTTGSGTDGTAGLDGFTITAGNANGPEGEPNWRRGGGMWNQLGSPTVTRCLFIANHARQGGGIANRMQSSPTISDCTFDSNVAPVRGGGMSNANAGTNPMVTNCTFSGNTAFEGGGMVNAQYNSTVKDCTFTGNTAEVGGGMANFQSSPTIVNCQFIDNIATGSGGGGICSATNCSPTITNCTFIGNSAPSGNGGGVGTYVNSFTTITNCTFSGNSAVVNGGGIFTSDVFGGHSETTVANTISWGNNPNEISDVAGATTTVHYSDVQGGWGGAGANNIDADPLFVDPDSDYRLQPGSPCIDAGRNAAVPAGITTDLDGNPRFVDDPNTPDCQQAPGTCGDPPVVDMGAYEFQGGPPCPWDCADGGNGDVGITDFLKLLADWSLPSTCDFDGGGVGITDFLKLLANWGPCP